METQNQCLTIDKICVPQIKIGKQQIFNSTTQHSLFPIYYQIKHNLIIKTARLFIPKKVKSNLAASGNYSYSFLEALFINQQQDEHVSLLKKKIIDIERRVQKLLKTRKGLENLKQKTFISLLKYDTYYKTQKILLPINVKTSQCFDVNNNIIDNWDIDAPTYGHFIILFKNVWIKGDKWGINLFTHGALALPSQLCDPPPIPNLFYYFGEEVKSFSQIGDDETYKLYFKMKRMGTPIPAIQQKMMMQGLNPSVITYSSNTSKHDIPELNESETHVKGDKIKNTGINSSITSSINNSITRNINNHSNTKSCDNSPNSAISNHFANLGGMLQKVKLKSRKSVDLDCNVSNKKFKKVIHQKNLLVPSLNDITQAYAKIKEKAAQKNKE
tara:strand:+ start:12422 stop:13579 length:1158 start_codon:yes stop_codon:yes gene_type:complete